MLIQFDDGRIINTDFVNEVEDYGDGQLKIFWSDGQARPAIDLGGGLERALGRLVAAAAGYSLVRAYRDKAGGVAFHGPIPIVAFRLGRTRHGLTPITLCGELTEEPSELQRAVVLPDKQCFAYSTHTLFGSLEEWKSDASERVSAAP